MSNYEACYCFVFDIPKDGNIIASDFVNGMKKVLLGIEAFNQSIINSFPLNIQVVSYIEELEQGSIKIYLKDFLAGLTDEKIENFVENPIRTIISSLLKRARKAALRSLEDTKGTSSLKERGEIIKKAVSYEVKKIQEEYQLTGNAIDTKKFFSSLSEICEGSKLLSKNVYFKSEKNEKVVIDDSFIIHKTENEAEIKQKVLAHIVVYEVIFDEKSTQWKFIYNQKIEKFDVSKCDIPAIICARGKVNKGDTFKVEIEVTEKKTKKGYKNYYKILKVIETQWSSEQLDLFKESKSK